MSQLFNNYSGPYLRIIIITTGIKVSTPMYETYIHSCTQISLTDAGFRWYNLHQTMPDDGGPRGFRIVSLAQPIIKSHGQFFLRGTRPRRLFPLIWPSVSRIDRITLDFNKSPQIHQRHSLTFRGGQWLMLQCFVCVFQ